MVSRMDQILHGKRLALPFAPETVGRRAYTLSLNTVTGPGPRPSVRRDQVAF
jgi:hypothetical protein